VNALESFLSASCYDHTDKPILSRLIRSRQHPCSKHGSFSHAARDNLSDGARTNLFRQFFNFLGFLEHRQIEH
jgi:hypothetical protein